MIRYELFLRLSSSAYGYWDEECLSPKVIASFLSPLPENARLDPH